MRFNSLLIEVSAVLLEDKPCQWQAAL